MLSDPALSDTAPLSTPRARRRAATRRIFLQLCGTALGVGIAAPLDARFIEPFAVEVTRHVVFLPDLPPEQEGLVIAHLTDLHRGPVTPDDVIKQAVRTAMAQNPDLVVLTGDFVHGDHRDAAPLAPLLAPLRSARLGAWGCLGNHDYRTNSDIVTRDLESGAGVQMLRNRSQLLAPGLWIAGIEDTLRGHPDMPRATKAIPHDAAAILLSHNPVGVFGCDEHPWLVLAGHTHGGQIRLPGLPPRYPPGMDGFPYIAGWGVFDKARLYINRGVGMSTTPLRFRCRPEVAVIVLRRGDGPPRAHEGMAVRAFHRAGRLARRFIAAG